LQGKRVLECGCGDGRLSVLLAEAGAEVYTFDISPVSVELCQRRAIAWGVSDRLATTVADLEDLLYPDMTLHWSRVGYLGEWMVEAGFYAVGLLG
jgi:2-polyprenyl-3-methyl-5-hydroxy-6-metoxy-1,4-benzoquinol methylase